MKLSDLLSTVSWPETKAELIWNYPDESEWLESYRLLLSKLRKMVPLSSDTRILLKENPGAEPGDRPFIDVSGRDGTLNKELDDFKYLQDSVDAEFANAETDYSLVFESWERWLGMDIDADTLAQFPAVRIVAHCLWEMTFHGFDQHQIQETAEELKRQVAEIEAMTEEERIKAFVPLEEGKKKFES